MLRASFPEDGLLLVQPRQSRLDAAIHMLFMRMDIAVIWLDERLQVTDVRLARRWVPLYVPKRPAQYVLEVAPDWLEYFVVGDQIVLEEV